MSAAGVNYFVCTLGEAAQDDIKRPFPSVNELIDNQAQTNPSLPAIGFYHVSNSDQDVDLSPKVLTFKQVRDGIVSAAALLSKRVELSKGESIGLLAASSPEFFFAWLGYIWLGHPVLLIAPQCSPAAIAHLCKVCDVSVLLTDEKHEDLAEKACRHATETGLNKLNHHSIPFSSLDDIIDATNESEDTDIQYATATGDDIAYLHHTSGTSSGLPKSIPQTQHGAVGVLPSLDGKGQATFTTTPLYHGGPADIFRAWSSNAMTWLFPSKDIPITAKNVTKCLNVSQRTSQIGGPPPIKYFTSVPYILQMMAEDEDGLKLLQQMDLVGVGGAALATEVGDKLVELGVNLVSRFGAAECGFLLSSHRAYDTDKAWQYLRHNEKVKQLKFVSQEEDLHELVVQPDWPHMAKRNREDGSYATSDLFAKHPDLPDAWKYHSRADSQLTLVTGKKFDPAPLEDAIVAASANISDVLLFGNGKPYPGALLFRSKKAESISSEDVMTEIIPVIEKLNSESQSHVRVPRNMLTVMPFHEQPLEKSSKGTILRKTAEESYASEIEAAYTQILEGASRDVPDEELPTSILDLVRSIVGNDDGLDVDADLFGQGVDSVACVQIRHGLSLLLPKDAKKLSLTVVEDSRTVTGLAELVRRLRHGDDIDIKTDQRSQIPDLIRQYSDLSHVEVPDESNSEPKPTNGKLNVLLTGPTGSLGAHVLSTLLTDPKINHIYLLVRGATPHAARERVLKALSSRLLDVPSTLDQKITILQCKLADRNLGLSPEDYETLRTNIGLIIHLAWSVNFLLSLHSFVPHFAGIQNLLTLSLSSSKSRPPRLTFCSSVASVSEYQNLKPTAPPTTNGTTPPSSKPNPPSLTPELILPTTQSSGPTGYALSKLTAELLLSHIATKFPPLHTRLSIIRVGQLSASTKTGVWSSTEAYPQILASAKHTGGKLPDLGGEEILGWLPVDIAAEAFVQACLAGEREGELGNVPTEHVGHKLGKMERTVKMLDTGKDSKKKEEEEERDLQIDTSAVRVLHLLNPNGTHTFTDFLKRLQVLGLSVPTSKSDFTSTSDSTSDPSSSSSSASPITIVPASEWLATLESIQTNSPSPSKDPPTTPSFPLLPFWKTAYSTRQPTPSSSQAPTTPTPTQFTMHNSLLSMPALTYWLGLSTPEGRRAGDRNDVVRELEGDTAGVEADLPGGSGSGNGNGSGSGDGDKDEGKGKGEEEEETCDSELLGKGYVEGVWRWVIGNVA